MDRELRELDRRAAQGDPHALHRLLLRLHSLGDFELTDLSIGARKTMATALMQTMNVGEQIEVLESSDSGFIPDHDSTLVCPNNPACSATSDDFTYHYLAWENHECFADDTQDPPTVNHQSNWETVLTTHLHCPQCQTTWRITDPLEWS
jgi:hypothetical protein